MSVRVSYKKQVVFFVLLIFLVLVIVEGFSRLYIFVYPPCLFMQSDVYSDHGYEYKKMMCYDNINYVWYVYPKLAIKPDQHFETMNINGEGFRGPEITREKPNDVYRIFVIGGSTAFAGSSDDATIAGYLQKEFENKEMGKNVEVINAGIINAFSFTETQYVKNRLLNYDPDLLIVYTGINDFLKPYDQHNNVWSDSVFKEKIATVVRQNYAIWNTPVVIRYLLEVQIPDQINKGQVIPFDDSNMAEKVELWKSRWTDICELGRTEGFDTLIVLQPMLGTSNYELTKHEQELLIQIDKPKYLESYQMFAAVLEEMKSYCINTVDFRTIFDGMKGPLYYDKYHVGDEGNQIIAQKLYEIFISMIKKD